MASEWTFGRIAYSSFMVLAMVAFFLARRWQSASSTGIPSLSLEERFALNMAAFVGGMLSAKLPFLLGATGSSIGDTAWLADGKTVTTGIAGAYASVELTKWVMGIRVKTGDGFAVPLAIALAIGRLGCFFYGCCYGLPTSMPWGIDFFGDGPRHPTQLYEVMFHAVMAAVLWELSAAGRLPTHRLRFYLIAYCVFRFATEFLRPELPLALGLTFYQWFCAAFALALALQWRVVASSVSTEPPHPESTAQIP